MKPTFPPNSSDASRHPAVDAVPLSSTSFSCHDCHVLVKDVWHNLKSSGRRLPILLPLSLSIMDASIICWEAGEDITLG